jgi:oxygen-independent coproporphyrinogen-3 oxidase
MTTPLALYFHWPFCRSKCTYCAFNSVARILRPAEERAWVQKLKDSFDWHIRHVLPAEGAFSTPTSLFFGGGTPSLLSPEALQTLITHVCLPWNCRAESLEITLEANPETLTEERLQAFAQAGVNRLSLGIQALSAQDLSTFGRRHSLEQALQALSWTKNIFSNYSADFLYGRPNQSLKSWRQELSQILALECPHLSLYELTLEPHTPLCKKLGNTLPRNTASFLKATQYLTEETGYTAYEISNFCQLGMICRHNLAYWRYHDYLGIGPGAHSRLCIGGAKKALTAYSDPLQWFTSVQQQAGGIEETILLSPYNSLIEHLLVGLRLKEGLRWTQLIASAGPALVSTLRGSPLFQKLQEGHFLKITKEGLRTTSKGRAYVDGIVKNIADIFPKN